MIKDILIPEKIGNYFIIPQKIIGIELGKTQINATQINISGKYKVIVEKNIQELLKAGNNIDYNDRAANVLKNIFNTFDKYNSIRVSLPSTYVIFKELKLPFIDLNKIKSILEFEVEPTLAFSIDEAVLDFIVVKQDIKQKQSTILVALARKNDIRDFLEPFNIAGKNPDVLIVDIISLYGLYKALYPEFNDSVLFVDIEPYFTNIAYMQNNQLRLIRSIQLGISNITKNIANTLDIDPNKAMEHILRFGLDANENEKYNKAIEIQFLDLLNKLQFTINSFKIQLPTFTDINKIILLGPGAEIKKLPNFLSKYLNIECKQLTPELVAGNSNFKFKEKFFPISGIKSLATAYPANLNTDFNLLRKEFAISNTKLLNKQILTSVIIIIIIFASLILYSQQQSKKLETELNNSKKEVITKLKDTFEITDPIALKNPNEVINIARNKVNEEESIWFSFSQQTRFSFLKYLQELSSLIDREALGLNLKKLTMTKNLITLEGDVKDFKALETLENELNESKLFSHVSTPQETSFTINITIKKNEGD